MLLALAGDVASKGNSIVGRAKIEAVEITGQIAVGVSREQVNFVPLAAERETGRHARVGIELRFIEDPVGTACQNRPIRNPIFFRGEEVVGQEPAAEIGTAACWVEQLDTVGRRRRIGARKGLVNHHRHDGGRRGVGDARRAVDCAAGPPVGFGIPGIWLRLFIDHDQRKPEAVGNRVPAIVIAEIEDLLAVGID